MTDVRSAWHEIVSSAEDWPEDWYHANMDAYLAMSGARPRAIDIIVRFLKSECPIHPILRHAIADAIEGLRPEGALNLKPQGLKSNGRVSAEAYATFKRHVEIGRYVTELLDGGIVETRSGAEELAVSKFHVSPATCNKITDSYRRMMRWADAADQDRRSHLLHLAETFDVLGQPALAAQRRSEAASLKPMTQDEKLSLCLTTYFWVDGPLSKSGA